MSKQSESLAKQPLDEEIFVNPTVRYSDILDSVKLEKYLRSIGNYEDVEAIIWDITRMHIDYGNIKALDELLRTLGRYVHMIFKSIIQYSTVSKNIDIYNFIKYLNIFLEEGIYPILISNEYNNNQTEVGKFFKEICDNTPCNTDCICIFPIKRYNEENHKNHHVSLQLLFKTIEKFSHPEVKNASNRK
jgi:hypothetical protein